MMTGRDVLYVYEKLTSFGITVWVTGGWGVDALLGKETRLHDDLDLFVQWSDALALRKVLGSQGYVEIKQEIAQPYYFVLGNKNGHEVDVHVFDFDGNGVALYRSAEAQEVFSASVFDGIGEIAGQSVKCITPGCEVEWHTGYEPHENDFKDVAALCEKFGIDYPAGYEHLKRVGPTRVLPSLKPEIVQEMAAAFLETVAIIGAANLILHNSISRVILHGSRGPRGGARPNSDLDLSLIADIPHGVNTAEFLDEVAGVTISHWRGPVALDLAVVFDIFDCRLECFNRSSWDDSLCDRDGSGCFGIYKCERGFRGVVTGEWIQAPLMYPCTVIWRREDTIRG